MTYSTATHPRCSSRSPRGGNLCKRAAPSYVTELVPAKQGGEKQMRKKVTSWHSA